MTRGRRPLLRRTDLPRIRRRYVDDDATIAEIAKEEGVGDQTIGAFLARHGIKRRPPGPRTGHAANTELDPRRREKVIAALKAGEKSMAQIGRENGISRQRVSQIAAALRASADDDA
jgi:transposase-like protein